MDKNHRVSVADVMRVAAAVICAVFGAIFLLAETVAVVTWLIPLLSLMIFQTTGFTVAADLTVASFAANDAVVILMMWALPSLAMVIIVSGFQLILIRWMIRKIINICVKMFGSIRKGGQPE